MQCKILFYFKINYHREPNEENDQRKLTFSVYSILITNISY